jgi:catechol 2,3-dioxygenase-like lactoylglutathione lyase family enzyme
MTMIQRTVLCLLAAVVFQSPDSAARLTTTPIRQIDHIMIRADDPGRLYAFFTEILQLPVAWTMMTPRPGVTTGGVGFGNVNVEAIRFPEQGRRSSPAQLLGFAFEPAPLRECLAELDRRGITYGEPRPLVSTGQDGSRRTRWTNVTLRQFSDSDGPADATMYVFLTEYSPTYVNVAERRVRLRKQLTESGGGPLGIDAVKEVVIGVTDLEIARGLWQKLLDPARSSGSNAWQVGSGPAIRLVKANKNAIQELVVSVNSLPRAKAFLRERALLGRDAEEDATIESSKVDGLNIRLVGRR